MTRLILFVEHIFFLIRDSKFNICYKLWRKNHSLSCMRQKHFSIGCRALIQVRQCILLYFVKHIELCFSDKKQKIQTEKMSTPPAYRVLFTGDWKPNTHFWRHLSRSDTSKANYEKSWMFTGTFSFVINVSDVI